MALKRISKVAIGVAAAYGIYCALGYWALPAGIQRAASGYASDLLGRQCSVGEAKFNPLTLELTLKDVRMAGHAPAEPALSIGSLYVNVAGIASLARFGLVLDALSVDRFSGELTVNDDGATSFQDVIDSIHKHFPPKNPPDEEGGVFRFSLNNIELTNSSLHILAPSRGVDERLTEISLGIPFIGSIGSDREIKVKPRLTLKDNGSPFAMHGQTLPFKDTMATQMHADISDYDLPHLAAMSPLPLDADVRSGKASISADITFAKGLKGAGDSIIVTVSGHADDVAAAMKGEAGRKNLIAFDRLALEQATINLTARTAEVAGISLASPNIALERLADGSLAWSHVIKTAAPDPAKEAAAAEPDAGEQPVSGQENSGFIWVVRDASITKGRFRLEDHAAGNALVEASELNASASNLTMKPGESTAFSLSTKILDGALKSSGSLSLDDLSGSLSLAAEKLNLGRISGYAELAGMKLAGRATVDAKAELAADDAPLSVQASGSAALEAFSLEKPGSAPLSLKLGSAKAGGLELEYKNDLSLKAASLELRSPQLDLPESGFASRFAKASAQALSLDWAAGSGQIGAGAKTLSLGGADVKAGAFEGRVGEFGANAFQAGWNGEKEEASVSGSLFTARGTALSAGAFSAAAEGSRARDLTVGWQGRKQSLSVQSSSIGITQTSFQADPVSGGAREVAVSSLSLGLASGEHESLSVKTASVKSEGSSLALAGDLPVKASSGTLELKRAELSKAESLSFSTASVTASELKSSIDLFDVNAGRAELGAVSVTQGADLAVKIASADLARPQVIAPVNAARVSALSDKAQARGIDWQSGLSGHSLLQSAEISSTAFEIAGGGSKFGRIASVSVTGVNAPSAGTANVERIAIVKPRYSVSRDAKGNLDIDPLLGKRQFAKEAAQARAEVTAKIHEAEAKAGKEINRPFRIGELSISEGELSFVDNSISPAGKFRFGNFNTSVKPVVYGGENTPSKLTMNALINGAAKLSVTGSGSPFVSKGKLTAKGSLTAVSMPFFTPYTVHYVSYPIQKGNLTVTSDITMTDMTKLNTTNHVLIEQLGWGRYIPNETSTNLPVVLATSLLTDSHGNLEFDLPISGDLADPEFSFSGLVLEGLKNLIIKVVAAPVNLLASIASLGSGGSSSRTVFLPYLSGQSRLTDQQKKLVGQIAKGMKGAPDWKLEITPVMSDAGDSEALHQKTYSGLLRVVQSTLPESERSREKAVNALFALQFPDDKTTESLADKESKLYEAVKPDFSGMADLADSRSRRLARSITEAGVPEKRIFITAPDFDKKSSQGGIRLKFIK